MPAHQIFVDGFQFLRNPSPIGGGFTLVDSQGHLIDRKIFEKTGLTCNEAELLGIARAINVAPPGSVIATDSQVARRWVLRGNSRSRPDLRKVIRFARKMAKEKKMQVIYVPRGQNLAGIYNERNRPPMPESLTNDTNYRREKK